MQQAVETGLAVLGVYVLLGVLFAIPFALRGAKTIDPSAVEGTRGFKMLLIPGVAILWPVLLKRWVKKEGPPRERSAHREGAS